MIKKERQKCQVFSRVNGWYTPVSNWNIGKKAEWNDRVPYVIKKTITEDNKS